MIPLSNRASLFLLRGSWEFAMPHLCRLLNKIWCILGASDRLEFSIGRCPSHLPLQPLNAKLSVDVQAWKPYPPRKALLSTNCMESPSHPWKWSQEVESNHRFGGKPVQVSSTRQMNRSGGTCCGRGPCLAWVSGGSVGGVRVQQAVYTRMDAEATVTRNACVF